jgi:hypothetical protein
MAAVPVKRGFGTGFVPLGFLCTARLSELADSREGTEERESHDVLLGVAGLCRSLRAPGGTRLERGIMLNRGISQGYGPATSVIERRDISGFALSFARRDVTARNA